MDKVKNEQILKSPRIAEIINSHRNNAKPISRNTNKSLAQFKTETVKSYALIDSGKAIIHDPPRSIMKGTARLSNKDPQILKDTSAISSHIVSSRDHNFHRDNDHLPSKQNQR